MRSGASWTTHGGRNDRPPTRKVGKLDDAKWIGVAPGLEEFGITADANAGDDHAGRRHQLTVLGDLR